MVFFVFLFDIQTIKFKRDMSIKFARLAYIVLKIVRSVTYLNLCGRDSETYP